MAAAQTRFFFVRHGEALHNPPLVKGNFKSKDPAEINFALLREARSIINPVLTDKGRTQAEGLAKKMEDEGRAFDLCITTPLARAIETSQLAFGKICAKFMINPELCETASLKLAGPQRGHSVAEMIEKHPYISQWDRSLMTESNWVLGEAIEPTEEGGGQIGPAYHNPVPVEDRVAPIAKWLLGLAAAAAEQEGGGPPKNIVVVGHSGVFDKLLGVDMGNCELIENDLAKWR